jgi:IS1 family transposase
MPITASVGALSYTKSADTNEFQYWYLETDQNAVFNNFLDGGRMVVVGQDTSNNEALFVSIEGFFSRPQIKYQYHQRSLCIWKFCYIRHL